MCSPGPSYQPRQSVLRAVLHGQRSYRQRFFRNCFELWAQACFIPCENAQPLDRRTSHYIGRITVERHQQSRYTYPLQPGSCHAGRDQSQVRTGAPVITAALAEGSDERLGMRREQSGFSFSDTASRVGSAHAQPSVVGQKSPHQRLDQSRLREDRRRSCLRSRQSPRADRQLQLVSGSSH